MDARRGGLKMKQALSRLVEWMIKPESDQRPSAAAAAAEFGTLTRDWDPDLPKGQAGVAEVEHSQDQVRAFLREIRDTEPTMWTHGAAKKTAVDGEEEAPRFTIERFGVVVERRPDAARAAQNQLRWEAYRIRSEKADTRLDIELA